MKTIERLPQTFTSDQQQQIEEELVLISRKEVYPYEYMDYFEQFHESQLPPKDTSYCSLREEDISETDYPHVQRVLNHFYMADLGVYHNFYLLTSVLVILFVNFRDTCLQHYGLDPAHNYTSLGLSWQVALKATDMELDLLTDIDYYLFIEEGIRGGVVMISH